MRRNLEWFRSGNSGCTFCTMLSRVPETIGWVYVENPTKLVIPSNAYIVSYGFGNKTKDEVIAWALQNGMYMERVDDEHLGLRLNVNGAVAYVQYFGQDSHCKTRQAPEAELVFCVKQGTSVYHKVGFKGILHIAHACVAKLGEKICDIFWERSYKCTANILGHKAGVAEAAKTTFLTKDFQML